MDRRRPLFLFFLIAFAAAVPAAATTWIRFEPLPALVAESRRAVVGSVVGVHHGYDDRGLHATFVTLEIEEALYGTEVAPGGTMDLKLYGSPEPMLDGSRLFVEGTPRYTIGDRVLLLLREDSPWEFTNTAGLMQGAFRLTAGPGGLAMAESFGGNGPVLGPDGLGAWLDADDVPPGERPFLDARSGPVPLALLRRAVLALRGGR